MKLVSNPLINTHSHLRDLIDVMAAAIFLEIDGGVSFILYMPNTEPWLDTAEVTSRYHDQCKKLVPHRKKVGFIPTAVISENTTLQMIEEMARMGILDVKIYPLKRTTNAASGVRDYFKLLPLIKRCGELGIRVHFHPEHPWMGFNNRDAEFAFLSIIDMFLRSTEAIIIWEHGTDARCIPFWKEMAKTGRFYVTLTAHHLATNEDETFGDVQATCKPSIKTPADQIALIQLVVEDHPWVMAGADDAPHPVEKKRVYGKCACGAYTAPFLLSLYAHALDILLRSNGGIHIFNRFVNGNARKLYNLPAPEVQYELEDIETQIPPFYQLGPWKVEPFWATKKIAWSHRLLFDASM